MEVPNQKTPPKLHDKKTIKSNVQNLKEKIMNKSNISQSNQKPNKKYHHARLYEYDLIQTNLMKRLVTIKIYCWLIFHAKVVHQDEKIIVRKTGLKTNNISQKTLENKIGRGRSVVQSGIAELKNLGLLEVKQRLGNPAVYTLTTPKHTDFSALGSSTPNNIESRSSSNRDPRHLSNRDFRQETNYNKSNNIYITKEENQEYDPYDFMFEKDSEG